MKRRNFLIGVGAVAPIAGCVSDTGEDEQPDQSPDEETTEEETAKDETVDEETATDEETAEEETATEETAEEEPIYQEEQEEELILPGDQLVAPSRLGDPRFGVSVITGSTGRQIRRLSVRTEQLRRDCLNRTLSLT